MLTCDHFIYTSAKTEKREGYQVIARSKGISDDMIFGMNGYLYPVGLRVEDFKESRSLFLLRKGKIAYSIVKNIGVGYDARKGTLYNHTFVIDKDDFREINYDSRAFERFFIMDPTLRGELDEIRIEKIRIPIKFDSIRTINSNILSYILRFLFLKRKIALVTETNHLDLIQNMLAVLPPSVRLLSFSTLVNEPSKQDEYDFIQIPKAIKFKLDSSWKVIELAETKESLEAGEYESGMEFEFLTSLILKRDEKALLELHKAFEELPETKATNKIQFLVYINLSESSKDILKKAEYTYECAKIAQNFDYRLAAEYLAKAKKYSIEVDAKELLSKIEVGELALLIEKEPLSLRLLDKVLDHANERNPEIKNAVLNSIIERKRKELSQYGYSLLKETLPSHSYYRDDILRLFVEEKMLNPFIIQLLNESKEMTDIQRYSLLETFVTISLSHNVQLLDQLFANFDMNLHRKEDLIQCRKLIYNIYSNFGFRENAEPEFILQVTKKFRTKFEQALNQLVIKEPNTERLKWNSNVDFEDFKYTSYNFMRDMSQCLQYILDYRNKELGASVKSSILIEIGSIESLVKKLHSISYKKPVEEYSPPTWFDWWLSWLGLK